MTDTIKIASVMSVISPSNGRQRSVERHSAVTRQPESRGGLGLAMDFLRCVVGCKLQLLALILELIETIINSLPLH